MKLNLDSNRLSELAERAKALADEEDVLDFDSDPDITAWQPTSQPGGGTGGGTGGGRGQNPHSSAEDDAGSLDILR